MDFVCRVLRSGKTRLPRCSSLGVLLSNLRHRVGSPATAVSPESEMRISEYGVGESLCLPERRGSLLLSVVQPRLDG